VRAELVRAWFAKAREDVEAAEVLLAASLSAYGTVSFLAQQAAEKALKALLIHLQVSFDRTHNVEELLRLAASAIPGIRDRLHACGELSPYAVAGRYPGGPVLGRDDAARHLALAREAVDTVAHHLGARPGTTEEPR
jgi:HEPN domain-containing protein